MVCSRIDLGNGDYAIVCGIRTKKQYCSCGRPADLLCDWKVQGKKSGTCDRPICREHAQEVAPDKHLCQEHQAAFVEWRKRHPEAIPQKPEKKQNVLQFPEASA